MPSQDDAHATLDKLIDRKSTRLNSSHLVISYAVFCLNKKRAAQLKVIGIRELIDGDQPWPGRPEPGEGLAQAELLFFFLMIRGPPRSTLFPCTTLFRSVRDYRPPGRRCPGGNPCRARRLSPRRWRARWSHRRATCRCAPAARI